MDDLEAARDPQTPGERLLALARSPLPEVQQAVAANPSAPVEVLLELGKRWPSRVTANPAWPLLFTEVPGLAARLTDELRTEFARGPLAVALLQGNPDGWGFREPTPFVLVSNPLLTRTQRRAVLCQSLARARSVLRKLTVVQAHAYFGARWLGHLRRAGLGRHGRLVPARCTPSVLEQVAQEGALGQELVVRAPLCPPALYLSVLERSGLDTNFEGQLLVPRSPELLGVLARSTDPGWRLMAAMNPALPLELQVLLARDPEADVRRNVAHNEALSPAVMPMLVNDPEGWVRRDLAGRSDVSLALRRQLLTTGEEARIGMAQADDLPASLLQELAQDPSDEVREMVSRRRRLPEAILRALAGDAAEGVKSWLARTHGPRLCALGLVTPQSPPKVLEWLAYHRRLPGEVMEWLAGSAEEKVRIQVVHRVLPFQNSRDPNPRSRVRLGWLTSAWFQKLATDPSVTVRLQLARVCRLLPSGILQVLAHDPHPNVREWVARNNLDEQVRLSMVSDPSPKVRASLLRKRTPEREAFQVELQRLLVSDPESRVRTEVAKNTSDPDLLRQLATDSDPAVRSVAMQSMERLDETG